MRVAIFTESYHQLNGVGSTYRNMAEYAKENGHELDIFIQGDGSFERDGCVTIYRIDTEAPIEYYPDLLFDAWTVPRHIFNILPPVIEENFLKRPYDIAMIATQGSMGLYAVTASRKFHVPLVGSYHTQIPYYAELRMKNILKEPKGPLSLLPKLAREATWFAESYYYGRTIFNLAPTNMVCGMINDRFKRPTKVFRRGIDISRFHPEKGKTKDGRTVLLVSRLAVEKNVSMLKGFRDKLRGARLVVVGDGPQRQKLECEIPEAEFKGFLTGDALAQEYASADVFIFPSITETYGNVVQEAMASGLPVVLDASGPTSELVKDGEVGLHYRNKEEMFSNLRTLLDDRELNLKMSMAARIEMEKRTWSSVFDSVWDDYRQAVRIYNERPKTFSEKWRSKMDDLFGPGNFSPPQHA